MAETTVPLEWGDWYDGVDIYIALDLTEPLADAQLHSLNALAQQWTADGSEGTWPSESGRGVFHANRSALHVDGRRIRFHVDGGSSDLEAATRALHERITAWSHRERVQVRQMIAGQDVDDEAWWQRYYRSRD